MKHVVKTSNSKTFAVLIMLAFVSVTLVQANEVTYPRSLTTNEIIAHYEQFPEVRANSEFELMITGNEAERECESCGTPTGYGSVQYRPDQSTICIDWDSISNPDSGCFNLVQVEEHRFELRKDNGDVSYKYRVASKPLPFDASRNSASTTALEYERAILLDLSGIKPTSDKMEAAIRHALVQRGWQLESSSQPDVFVGSLVKSSKLYRVMIKSKEHWLGIGFVKGYSTKRDNWLRNLELDIRAQFRGL